MDARRLSDDFSVAPQIAATDVPDIAAAGFRGIVCNRPDGEEPGQPAEDGIAAAAREAGLEFRSIPISGGMVRPEDLARFRAALDEMPGPVLAYCRSGTRCTMLWSMAQFGRMPSEHIVDAAARAGYDMAPLVAQMTPTGG